MSLRLYVPLLLAAQLVAASLPAQSPGRTPVPLPASTAPISHGDDAAYFSVVEEYDGAGASSSAIRGYRAFLKKYPASPLASRAQYRVAELYESQGNLNRAFDNYQTLVTRYPDTPEFERAVAQQVIIANKYMDKARVKVFGFSILPGTERAQQMYEAILKNAPYSKHAPVAQFNLGLSFERLKKAGEARQAFQTVLDKYPNSDVADDAFYQIGYIYMVQGLSGRSQDLSALIVARETFEDFLLQYPNSEKAPQARDNLAEIGGHEAGDLMKIAKYYDWAKNQKGALIYYNEIIRKQPKTADAETAKLRVQELRSEYGEDALRVGPERAETGERTALRRRLEAQVETSALADYNGPPKRDIVPDELPIAKPRMRTNMRDMRPLPAPVEPVLPTQ